MKIKTLFTLIFVLLACNFYGQDTLRIMFTGDIMVHDPQIQAAWNSGTRSYDFEDSFVFVKKIFRKADFVIGNLETTLGVKPYSGYPRFSSPPALATALKKAGFTHLVTANNHSTDKSKEGIVKTIQILDSLNLGHTGTYASIDEKLKKPFAILNQKSFKIILLNYTYGTNGLPVPSGTYVNLIDTVQIKKDIEKARKENPDEIIVFLHWGEQYRLYPSYRQKQLEKFLHSQGIRIIIGSHPHVVQPIRMKDTLLTAYSLGNFISNQRTFPRDGALILVLDFIRKDNKTLLAQAGYIPTWVYKYHFNGKLFFEILPVDEFIIEKAYFENPKDFQVFLRYQRHIIRFMKKNSPGIKRLFDFVPMKPLKLQPVFPILPPIEIENYSKKLFR